MYVCAYCLQTELSMCVCVFVRTYVCTCTYVYINCYFSYRGQQYGNPTVSNHIILLSPVSSNNSNVFHDHLYI